NRRVLQIICTPLQYGVAYGLRAGVAPQQAERAGGQLGVNIYGHDVPAVARLVKQVWIDERVQRILEWRRGTSVDGFPFQLEEAAKAPQRLADIDADVLSLAGAVSPQRRNCYGLGGETDRRHAAKPMRAGDDRVRAVEGSFAAAVRGRHPNVFEH